MFDTLTDDVVSLRREIDALECEWLQRVRAAERSGVWQAEGFVSMASWLRTRCNLTPGAAAGAVALARSLEALPETAKAFAAGEISRSHARVIADAATPERLEMIQEMEEPLVDAARVCTPRKLHEVVRRYTDAFDGDGGAASAERQYERRRLHVSRTFDGMVALDGLFDPENGAWLISALADRMAIDPRDGRTRAQQRADALIEVCRGEATPHLNIGVDLELLEQRGGMRGECDHVGSLPATTLRRMACDAGISRVITRGRSEVLDVGRTTRTVPAALLRALAVRDGGCVAPGCDRPPEWCDAHHIRHWVDGGPTSLDNLELLCRRHHRMRHEGMRDEGSGHGGGSDPP